MILFFLLPITFTLGWFSRYTVIIDRGLIATILLILGFTPLFSTGFSGLEGAPDFHSRDFVGPWVWLFNQMDTLSQAALIIAAVVYFLGKIGSFLYLVSKLPE